jgi:glyoxylase-like metal-dependent hydrolase (beta-lactamase superfamily II)/rhodanese-related sulfurtransferase
MKVEQLYTGCLAEAAYYIESKGEAVIIDPLRETKPYLQKLERNGATLKYILETHFHADFVSGHVDLAKATGATIVYGPNATTGFNSYSAKDGEVLKVGDITIEVLHTPGHTMESTTYLLRDEKGKPYAIFTGDTLFIGDVGRPDLAIKGNVTEKDLAGMLYDSLNNKIKTLPDNIIVYPGHGAGSACGKNMSKDTYDTLGNQKEKNYALKATNKDQFVKQVLEGLTPPPSYFSANAMLNKEGYQNVDEVVKTGTIPLSVVDFEIMQQNTHAIILDTRNPVEFKLGFIPGSINVGLDGQFAPWTATLIPELHHPILLITDENKQDEAVLRMARVGFDNIIGYLEGGFSSWSNANKPIDSIPTITPKELKKKLYEGVQVIDLRRNNEYEKGHLEEAIHLPLDYIDEWTNQLDKNKTYYLHCAGGYRSVIAESILRTRGFYHLVDIEGGFSNIDKELGITTLKKQGWLKSLFSFIKN